MENQKITTARTYQRLQTISSSIFCGLFILVSWAFFRLNFIYLVHFLFLVETEGYVMIG